jgi:hypothetical protein
MNQECNLNQQATISILLSNPLYERNVVEETKVFLKQPQYFICKNTIHLFKTNTNNSICF